MFYFEAKSLKRILVVCSTYSLPWWTPLKSVRSQKSIYECTECDIHDVFGFVSSTHVRFDMLNVSLAIVTVQVPFTPIPSPVFDGYLFLCQICCILPSQMYH